MTASAELSRQSGDVPASVDRRHSDWTPGPVLSCYHGLLVFFGGLLVAT